MSARGRERKRAIRRVEAALANAAATLELALLRIRSVKFDREEPDEGPSCSPEPPGATRH